MSYKIIKIGWYYPDIIKQIYASDPELVHQNYKTQMDTIMWQCMSPGEGYTRAFCDLGHEAYDIITNGKSLLKQWAKEHDLDPTFADDQKAILFDQIAYYDPEILLIFGGEAIFSRADLQQLKERLPHLKMSVVFTGAPAPDFSRFYEYDLVISNIRELVAYYARQGLSVHHMHHGFDPRVLDRFDTTRTPDIPFGFAGSIMKVDRYHNERERLLTSLVRKTDLQVWSNVQKVSSREIYAQRTRQFAYDVVDWLRQHGASPKLLNTVPGVKMITHWPQRPADLKYVDQRIARRAHPPVYGLAMYQLLHNFKVSLNSHIDESANSASNLRLYEATGVGSCLLTDWKDDLHTLFEVDNEVVTYRSPEECIEKVRYLLTHDDERQRIARAGQKRTLRDHTIANRVNQLQELITAFMDDRL